jgi:hypothetical protein
MGFPVHSKSYAASHTVMARCVCLPGAIMLAFFLLLVFDAHRLELKIMQLNALPHYSIRD